MHWDKVVNVAVNSPMCYIDVEGSLVSFPETMEFHTLSSGSLLTLCVQ